GDYTAANDVTIGGGKYRLYTAPLASTIWDGEHSSQLVIAGLRRLVLDESRGPVLPDAFIIWSALPVLTTFTLLWPLLKFFYISPKERLQHRHLAYLVASVFGGAGLLTLLLLNASYNLRERRETARTLQDLAAAIKANFDAELGRAARFAADTKPST